jgi:YD repeat-containing protein
MTVSAPGQRSYLNGYRDPQGQQLKFERDSNRRLVRLTSPGNQWIHMSYGTQDQITEIHDSRSRTVQYGYDERNRLVSVVYPSGEVFHYEYDNTQHVLAFSVAPNAHSAPQVLLRNEFENGLLTKQTLSDGSVYSYTYDSVNPLAIRKATVHASNGRTFFINVADGYSIVREQVTKQDVAVNSSPLR